MTWTTWLSVTATLGAVGVALMTSLTHPDMGNGRLMIEFWPRYLAAVVLCVAGFALALVRR